VIARRYAAALFDVVEKNGTRERNRTELEGIAKLVADHEELEKVFESPSVPASKKRAVADAILTAAGGTAVELRRLLLMLADHHRLGLVGEISRSFSERAMQASRVMPAEVVTAAPLDADGRAALAAALGRATGSEITITERVDPTIVGGVVARVGSVVFDGSVTRQIERLRQKLLAGA
jgi:F-type H+-transporting ATPase subunit delta